MGCSHFSDLSNYLASGQLTIQKASVVFATRMQPLPFSRPTSPSSCPPRRTCYPQGQQHIPLNRNSSRIWVTQAYLQKHFWFTSCPAWNTTFYPLHMPGTHTPKSSKAEAAQGVPYPALPLITVHLGNLLHCYSFIYKMGRIIVPTS